MPAGPCGSNYFCQNCDPAPRPLFPPYATARSTGASSISHSIAGSISGKNADQVRAHEIGEGLALLRLRRMRHHHPPRPHRVRHHHHPQKRFHIRGHRRNPKKTAQIIAAPVALLELRVHSQFRDRAFRHTERKLPRPRDVNQLAIRKKLMAGRKQSHPRQRSRPGATQAPDQLLPPLSAILPRGVVRADPLGFVRRAGPAPPP